MFNLFKNKLKFESLKGDKQKFVSVNQIFLLKITFFSLKFTLGKTEGEELF